MFFLVVSCGSPFRFSLAAAFSFQQFSKVDMGFPSCFIWMMLSVVVFFRVAIGHLLFFLVQCCMDFPKFQW